MNLDQRTENWYIKTICLVFTGSFFLASLAGAAYLNIWDKLISGWYNILISPSPLVTDYFQTGNLASAFFNAGMCGLAWCGLMFILKADCDVNTFAGFILVVAHSFYGLNFLNMWPPVLGILLFCKFYKINFRDNLAMAMFSTAFAPFISELLFRYHIDEVFMFYKIHFDVLTILYVIIFSIFIGFAIPAMLPGTMRLHKGFNLYNGGLAFGLLGLVLYAFMYKTMGITPPGPYNTVNKLYAAHGNSYMGFVVIFFLILFTIFLVWGWFDNDKSFSGYGALMLSSGYKADFADQFGYPYILINIGVYGYMMLAYFTAVILLTDGVGFTGATTGVILASLTFTMKGQHPKNVWPIILGFVALSAWVHIICFIADRDIPWTLSSQSYLNAVAFATGLCPIVGHFGKRYGLIAGFICAIICRSTSQMHGGYMLYNGGFSAGITAMIMVAFLEYYWKEPDCNCIK